MFNAEQSSEGRRLPLNQAKLIQILKHNKRQCREAKVLSLAPFTRSLS